MQKFTTAALAAAFATASSLAILASGAQQPAQNQQGFLSSAPVVARADGENEGGDNNDRSNGQNCYNSEGHQKGWCKHHGRNDNEGRGRGRNRNGGSVLVTGVVEQIDGQTIYFRRDNGQTLTFIDNTNLPLGRGQRIVNLRLYRVRGGYALAPYNNYNNGNYNGSNNPYNGQGQRAISGVVLVVVGSTLTFVNQSAIDISQAQSRGDIRVNLTPGARVTAYGYYDSGNRFHAVSIR
ncbi:MAG: hypothetical protein M3126_09155 [Candidatus Eremiobacteraeota bacterium]|nr:hypothetical protein [Candidatus Eremiobacteraeota bacterium]